VLDGADLKVEPSALPELVLAGALPCSLLWRQLWIVPVGPEAEAGGARAFDALVGPGLLWGFLTGTLAVSMGGLLCWLRFSLESPPLVAIPLAILGAPLVAVVLLLLLPFGLAGISSSSAVFLAVFISVMGGLCTASLVAWLWKYHPVRHPAQPLALEVPTGAPAGPESPVPFPEMCEAGENARRLRESESPVADA